jgi:hypothetical protein
MSRIRSHGHYKLTKGVVHRFWKKTLYNIPEQISLVKNPTPTPYQGFLNTKEKQISW